MPVLPVLHAAQGAVETAPPLGAWLLLFAAAVCAGSVAGYISRNRRPALPGVRTRRRATWAVAWTLTLLAVVPSVIPYDHIISAAGHDEGHAAVHAAHCHESPAACADAPVTSGPGQMVDAAPLALPPAMLLLLMTLVLPTLVGITRRPMLRPPLGLAVASH